MHGNVTAITPKPELRHRTITLTNTSPVDIIETDWAVLGHGEYKDHDQGFPIRFEIDFRVRFNGGRYIISGRYEKADEIHDDEPGAYQTVRVGHFLEERRDDEMENLHAHILAVGDEMRERINCVEHRRFVMFALDELFASLPRLVLFSHSSG